MKNYSKRTNKKLCRYRTSSTFRGNIRFEQIATKHQTSNGYDAHISKN